VTGALIRIVCDPTGKQAYAKLMPADRARDRLEAQTGRPHRVYVCEFCGLFHVTSQGRRRRRAGSR